ncbi:carboxyl transferase domain-containing protein [Lentisalinibacter sediminis]|uniref:carboxyl transferase domain-containing protein n=1 Tax=Lentisalinibacter sediminis TaxID=2992237 RepID=UPI003869810B
MTGELRKLAIANRGEIAVRILRTAAVRGLQTVALFSDDEPDSTHVRLADEAVPLAGSGPAAYLDMDRIIAAVKGAGADCVHPGYGFLSESAEFARRCEAAGIVFIGPGPDQLELFGDKVAARQLALDCGIPCLGDGKVVTLGEARDWFDALQDGAAMVIKAVSGGGGRGMRVVRRREDIDEAYARCRSEAQGAFGDGRLYVERLLPRARHVEIQVIGDGQGAWSHLYERECSIQRRHQKVVEIAPSPVLSDALRERLFEAALALASRAGLRSLATVEFLVDSAAGDDSDYYFIEVNPRIQVEHTVTEEVLGIDLVDAQLAIAEGVTLERIGLDTGSVPMPAGHAVQFRVNAERVHPDGTTTPGSGRVESWNLPAGPGIRVDTGIRAGDTVSSRFDSLLAKVIVHSRTGDFGDVIRRARVALRELRIDGVPTNLRLLRRLTEDPEFLAQEVDTGFLDRRLHELLAGEPGETSGERNVSPTDQAVREEPLAGDEQAVAAPLQGMVVEVMAEPGQAVQRGEALLVLEAMKMEHVIAADTAAFVRRVTVSVGEQVMDGQTLAVLEALQDGEQEESEVARVDPDLIRPELREVLDRRALTRDEARPEAVERRHRRGGRTARENIADLVDEGTFTEYGSLIVAAQTARRPEEALQRISPADGVITGMGNVNGGIFGERPTRCLVVAYDYTVMAGTQGLRGHQKKDRVFELAWKWRLPVVLFAEGGGGRPGDTDIELVLESPSFLRYARLSGRVPLVGIVSGYCFAGNTALLGCSDVIIATRGSNIGMAGPAMIEGAGLGRCEPTDIGPVEMQARNGAVDIVVEDEREAVATARRYLAYFQGDLTEWRCADQRLLRHAVPENRTRAYDVRHLISLLADEESVLELRRDFGRAVLTALARIEGRAVGIIASDNARIGGAIDSPAADKAARFMQLCDAFGIPILNLLDTPGFMVGPEAEEKAQVRHLARMFVTASHCEVPVFTVVLRKAYGLGALAAAAGSFHASVFSVAWPTGEFGPMGLEGAVRLSHRRELEALDDEAERKALFDRLVGEHYQRGKAVRIAGQLEIDEVIDPAETRAWIVHGLETADMDARAGGGSGRFVDPW